MTGGAAPPPIVARLLASERLPVALFAIAAVASTTLLLALGWNLTFLLDDWTFLVYRDGLSFDTVMSPHNEHIVVLPVLIYKAVTAAFGIDSAVPFRVVATATFVLSAALLFVYARRRVGAWPALLVGILALFLGAAWEDLLWPFQIGFFAAMAAGLGALLALERGDRRGDRIATALLCVSVLSSSLGLAFAAGALVAVLWRAERRTSPLVFIAPLVVYALWWIGWGREAETSLGLANILSAPAYVFDGFAASIASVLGLSTPRDEAAVGALEWGRPLAVLAFALTALVCVRRRGVTRGLAVVAAVALAFWTLAAFNEVPDRPPTSSRYQYMGGFFVLLIAVELLRPARIDWRALAAAFAVGAAAIASNVSFLSQSADSYQATSDQIRASLAAVEIAGDLAPPEMRLSEQLTETAYVGIEVGPYRSVAAKHGTPAYDEAELVAAGEAPRRAADKVLSVALGLTFTPQPAAEAPQGPCDSVDMSGGTALVELPPGGATIEGGRGPVDLSARRFATESFPVPVGSLAPGETGALAIPEDAAAEPWELEITAQGGDVSICPPSP